MSLESKTDTSPVGVTPSPGPPTPGPPSPGPPSPGPSSPGPPTPFAVPIKRLSDIDSSSLGSFVKFHGWVYGVRTQGSRSLVFIDIGDGSTTTPVRCIVHQPEVMSGTSGISKPTPEQTEQEQEGEQTYGSVAIQSSYSADEEEYQHLTFEQICQASHLSLGCSVAVIGCVAKPPEGTTQQFEIKVISLSVIGGVEDVRKYPIQKSILKKLPSLRTHYHARFRALIIQQLMWIRHEALFAVHEFFHQESVPLLDPSIMTSSDCEGAGEVFKVSPQFFSSAATARIKARKGDDVDQGEKACKSGDHEVGLTVSSQLPLEAIAMGTGSVYTCQKSFRAETSDTSKHLAEFLHVEYERYFITFKDLLDFTERFVKYLIQSALERCERQYDFLDDKKTAPEEFHGHRAILRSLLVKPFMRITHQDAVALMQLDLRDKVKHRVGDKEVRLKFKVYPKQGEDLGSEHEKYLVEKFGTCVFVTHWPSQMKSFYMKQVGDGTCESFDLLAPLVGELFGGSMREWRYQVLVEEMRKRKMDFGPLQWFVDLRKDGSAPHGGWGMGFDRLVMLLTGARSVRDIVPYPVYYGHCPY